MDKPSGLYLPLALFCTMVAARDSTSNADSIFWPNPATAGWKGRIPAVAVAGMSRDSMWTASWMSPRSAPHEFHTENATEIDQGINWIYIHVHMCTSICMYQCDMYVNGTQNWTKTETLLLLLLALLLTGLTETSKAKSCWLLLLLLLMLLQLARAGGGGPQTRCSWDRFKDDGSVSRGSGQQRQAEIWQWPSTAAAAEAAAEHGQNGLTEMPYCCQACQQWQWQLPLPLPQPLLLIWCFFNLPVPGRLFK